MGKKKDKKFDRKTCDVYKFVPYTEQPEENDLDEDESAIATTTVRY